MTKKSFIKSALAQTIIERCRDNDACAPEFRRLIESETELEFLKVLTDNWGWCFLNNVLDFETVVMFDESVRIEAKVFAHTSGEHAASEGYWLASGDSTVRADGNSTVRAYENSTVRAYGNSTVSAYGNSTVSAYGNSTVSATCRATINSYNSNGHEVKEYAVCRFIGSWPDYPVTFKMADGLQVVPVEPKTDEEEN